MSFLRHCLSAALAVAAVLLLSACYAEFEQVLPPGEPTPLARTLVGEWRFIDISPADLARAPQAVPPVFKISSQPDGSLVAQAAAVAGAARGYELSVSRLGGRDFISARAQPGTGPWYFFRANWDPAKRRLALEAVPGSAVEQLIKAGLLKGKPGALTPNMVTDPGAEVAGMLRVGTLAFQPAFTLQKSGK
ncbi:MAG: hypothetical protein JSR82_22830 [Verrucomicrobia bacterium]|nr:hypothetical protein [Verrucomicrobiota bacterium]